MSNWKRLNIVVPVELADMIRQLKAQGLKINVSRICSKALFHAIRPETRRQALDLQQRINKLQKELDDMGLY